MFEDGHLKQGISIANTYYGMTLRLWFKNITIKKEICVMLYYDFKSNKLIPLSFSVHDHELRERVIEQFIQSRYDDTRWKPYVGHRFPHTAINEFNQLIDNHY